MCIRDSVYSKPWAAGDISLLWMPSALQGGLFILLFQLIGLASQRIGISPTTVASKMSLALTVLITVLIFREQPSACLLYTSDAADERSSVDLGGRRIIKKKIYYTIIQLKITYKKLTLRYN